MPNSHKNILHTRFCVSMYACFYVWVCIFVYASCRIYNTRDFFCIATYFSIKMPLNILQFFQNKNSTEKSIPRWLKREIFDWDEAKLWRSVHLQHLFISRDYHKFFCVLISGNICSPVCIFAYFFCLTSFIFAQSDVRCNVHLQTLNSVYFWKFLKKFLCVNFGGMKTKKVFGLLIGKFFKHFAFIFFFTYFLVYFLF